MRGSLSASGTRLLRDEAGASAIEFALVLLPLILLTLGTINAGLLIYTVATLNFATQDAARCATVKTTVCDSQTHLQSYARANYGGLTAAPTFTLSAPTTGACAGGNFVNASATYQFVTGLSSTNIPLSATACFPKA